MILSLYDPAFLAKLKKLGPNLDNYYFYQDFSSQPDGPKALPTTMNFGTTDFQPALLLYGEDATTSGWINRGTLGGTLSAVNIRPQDIGLDTPYKTTVAKGVRCQTQAGIAERYYEFTDPTIMDLGTDDFFFEAVYARPAGGPANATIFNKRNVNNIANIGYNMHSTTTTNMAFSIRNTSGALQTASVSTTAFAWTYTAGYLDFSDGGTTGMRIYRGNDSSGVVAHSGTSAVNTLNFRVGAMQNSAAFLEQDIILVYLAIWKASDLGFVAGTQEPIVTPIIRERQMILAGTKPLKTPAPFSYSDAYRISHRVRNGKKQGYRTGSGFTVTDDFILPNGTVESGLYFHTSIGANSVAGESLSTWTQNNTTLTNNATVPSPIDIWLTSGPSSMIGAAGTGPKSISFANVSPNTVTRAWQVFVKAGNKNIARIAMTSGTITNPIEGYLDLTTGQFVGTVIGEMGVIPYTNDWYMVYWRYVPATTDNTTIDFSFVDAAGSTNCTGDGSTINGYIYGAQVVVLNIPFGNLPINLTSETATSPIMNFVGTAIAEPYSLLAESFSEAGVVSTPTAPVPIAFQTDGSNIVNLFQGGAGTGMRIGSNALNGAAPVPGAQWSLFNNAFPPDWQTSAKTRSAISCLTDNINLLGESGVLGTDTLGTPPSNLSVIRIGANANNTAQGYLVQTSRSVMFNKAIATVSEE